jgi:hypothetical protein
LPASHHAMNFAELDAHNSELSCAWMRFGFLPRAL